MSTEPVCTRITPHRPSVRGLELLAVTLILLLISPSLVAQMNSQTGTVLFWEVNFPSTDTSVIPPSRADQLFSNFTRADSNTLPSALDSARTLVLPYGSAFPEEDWTVIEKFLRRGGNLVVLGGKPFSRPAFLKNGNRELRPETLAYSRALRIFGYNVTASSDGLTQVSEATALPKIAWRQAWSVTIRLSETSINERDGASGTLDADLTTLLWGKNSDYRVAAPIIQIDHISRAFVGGRWILLNANVPAEFWNTREAAELVRRLVEKASQGPQRFTVEPQYAVFRPGEPWRFELTWDRPTSAVEPVRLDLTIDSGGASPHKESIDFTPAQMPFLVGFQVQPFSAKGLVKVHAALVSNGKQIASHETGFWMRDDAALRSGPVVSLDHDHFLIDGKVQPVVGTTYMASDVQRQYFDHPNPAVWDRDMAEIQSAGINMLRAGWWSGWNTITENGVPTEKSLRALEAYLLTAQKHRLPVQWTFFAFAPEVLGGKNPYLDPAALESQKKLIGSVVERFRDVPFLIYDLVNEPSFSNPNRLWQTRPNGDEFEQNLWTNWLLRRYGDRASVATAWHMTSLPADGPLPLPSDADFAGTSTISSKSAARAHDYIEFAQEGFAAWAEALRSSIRAAGSKQLVTVGQDEGGVGDRLLASYFAQSVDFTTNHTWWLNDALLWDSLAAKTPGIPLLIQETGMQHETFLDGFTRRTEQNEGWVVERKIATALATSAGAIEWLWNTNAYMMPEQELPIGALHPDGTIKPEGEAMVRFARFARENAQYFGTPAPANVVVLTSQALQFSPYIEEAITAQQRAVRTLEYDLHITAAMLAENQIDRLVQPKLFILPSPQALKQHTWDRLLEYVRSGGNLLITGPVERDEHWYPVDRLSKLVKANAVPLQTHYSELQIGEQRIPLSYNYQRQQRLERLAGVSGIQEVAVGKGHIYITTDPVELAESDDATAAVYSYVLKKVAISPAYDASSAPKSVLIRASATPNAMLY
ncbi:MAG TPA: hypothetical protein VF135_03700, partial [Terriglobales bacterium]